MQKIKSKWPTVAAWLLTAVTMHAHAQVAVQNNGTLFVTGPADIVSASGSMTNASTALLTNNGNLYLQRDLINDQPSIAPGTGTLYFNGSAAQVLAGAQVFKTFNFISNNPAGITFNNSLSVSGLHTFAAGIITTSATPDYLVYEPGASYTGDGDSRHVKGWVRKTGSTSFVFPVGNGTVERTVATGGLTALSVFNAYYAGPTTNTGNIMAPLVTVDPNEYWIVDKLSGGNAVVTLNWDNSKIPMPNYLLANIRAAYYTGGYWTQAGSGATGNTSTTGMVSTGSTGTFGAFVVGSISYALPLTILQFTAHSNNGKAVLQWTVSDESDLASYVIQRSNDGLHFYSAGTIAAGHHTAVEQYVFTDPEALNAVTYYRLMPVDITGRTTYSKIVSLNTSGPAGPSMIAANPVHHTIYINTRENTGVFTYRITTIAGQTMQQGNLSITGQQTAGIALYSAVQKGWVILEIKRPGFYYSERLLVQ